MKRKVKIASVGGGSRAWCPTIIRDILKIEGIRARDFRLLDINPAAARQIAKLGEKMGEKLLRANRRYVPQFFRGGKK